MSAQGSIEIPSDFREKTQAAIDGDPAALGMLFEWFRPRLLAHALRICGNTPAAQDAVQDSFLAALTHIHLLRQPDRFYPWLRRILLNNCYQSLRKQRVNQLEEKLERSDLLIRQSIEAHFDTISDQQRLYTAVQSLSEELRSCVLLRYFSRFNSYVEIACVLGIPVGTVRSRLAAARVQLLRQYSRNEDAGDAVVRRAKEWSGYYHSLWTKVYDDEQIRQELFGHMHPDLTIRFTSGRSGRGRKILEKEVDDDLLYGTRFHTGEITSCGNISLIEGVNSNPPEHPDRCPPSSVFVLFRQEGRVVTFHLFDILRNKSQGQPNF